MRFMLGDHIELGRYGRGIYHGYEDEETVFATDIVYPDNQFEWYPEEEPLGAMKLLRKKL